MLLVPDWFAWVWGSFHSESDCPADIILAVGAQYVPWEEKIASDQPEVPRRPEWSSCRQNVMFPWVKSLRAPGPGKMVYLLVVAVLLGEPFFLDVYSLAQNVPDFPPSSILPSKIIPPGMITPACRQDRPEQIPVCFSTLLQIVELLIGLEIGFRGREIAQLHL